MAVRFTEVGRTANGIARGRYQRQHPEQASLGDLRACLVERLRSRQPELEELIFSRIRLVGGPVPNEDAEYELGLRAAVSEGTDYCLAGLERGPDWVAPIPLAVVEEIRLGARSGIALETSMLRLIAGHRLLGEFITEEAEHVGLSRATAAMLELRATQEALLEHVTPTIMSEHARESERAARSAEQRRSHLVHKLLAREHADASELRYELDAAWHLGIIAIGVGGKKVLTGLAARTGLAILSVARGEDSQWAWLGAPLKLPLEAVVRLIPAEGISFAVGEPARGAEGWRLTHEQAQAALLVALRRRPGVTRCAEVSLEAAILRHDGLRRSLLGS